MIKLYPHQEEALNQTKDFNRVAYYLAYGRDGLDQSQRNQEIGIF